MGLILRRGPWRFRGLLLDVDYYDGGVVVGRVVVMYGFLMCYCCGFCAVGLLGVWIW